VVRTPYAGQQYLVGLAGESEWVRNVRAAAGRAIIRHCRARRVVLEEVPLAERGPMLWAYLHRPGWSSPAQEARHYFGLPPDAAVENFRLIAERYPVFRVTTPSGRDTKSTRGSGAGRRGTRGVDHGLLHWDRPCGGRRARGGGVPRRRHRP
jgi:hypothetical protein